MHYRTLGKSKLKVSEIGFGAWQIGGTFGKSDDAEALRSIQLAIDNGVNFFDTAYVYGDGHSETLIGQAIAGQRDKVIIASKVPPKTFKWQEVPKRPVSETFPADWIVQCTEKSLSRLKIDCLDVQQLHAWSEKYVEQTEWLDGLEKLKKQGKIKAAGVSANSWEPYDIVELAKSGKVDSIQVIYNIFEQRPAEKLLPAAKSANMGIIVRVPFEEGLLTGMFKPDLKIDPTDWRNQWLTPERRKEVAPRVASLEKFLSPEIPTLATLALKYCLSHPAVTTVIPGMRRTKHVTANCAASDGRPLSEKMLHELSQHAFVHGWKYPWATS